MIAQTIKVQEFKRLLKHTGIFQIVFLGCLLFDFTEVTLLICICHIVKSLLFTFSFFRNTYWLPLIEAVDGIYPEDFVGYIAVENKISMLMFFNCCMYYSLVCIGFWVVYCEIFHDFLAYTLVCIKIEKRVTGEIFLPL